MDEVIGGIFATVIMGMLLITIVAVWGWAMMRLTVSMRKMSKRISH